MEVLRLPRLTAVLLGLVCGMSGLTPVPARAADAVTSAREIEQQFRRGETALAWQRLDQALVVPPGDTGLRFLKGVMLSETGRIAEAAALFERLTQEFPDLPEPHNNLAVLQAAAGNLDGARARLESALRLDPGYRTAHENLGDVFVRLALRAFEAAAGPRSEAPLLIKLRLARELAALR
jgi:Flp pilus assembly protein TadD